MAESRAFLERLLNIPDLPAIVPKLEPEVLLRVIQAYGLEDCAEFLALATPEQLARVLDADVWRAPTPGADEAFDPDRFGLWLTMLMQSGAAVAAEKLAGLEIDLVITGLAHHIRVFDNAAASSYTTLDGDIVPGRKARDGLSVELGGYLIEAARSSAWDAIVDVLALLEAEHPAYFCRVLGGCVRLSNGPREEDGFHDLLDDRDQDLFDLARGREARREQLGYAAPAEARAFLQEGRALRLDAHRPPASALARAYFRAIDSTPAAATTDAPAESAGAPATLEAGTTFASEAEGTAAIFAVLEEAGLAAARPRKLLGTADRHASNLSFVRAHAASQPASEQELAYLTNTILAGCSIQDRALSVQEASECVIGVCNLGLENWPRHWSGPDLITAFQVGWTILHHEVCMYTAERLIEILAGIQCSDRDIQLRLDGLRRGLIRHAEHDEPWQVGQALDVVLMLDASSWAALRALIAECPVIHAALTASRQHSTRAIHPTDFAFISERHQIADVREFLAALPSLLTG